MKRRFFLLLLLTVFVPFCRASLWDASPEQVCKKGALVFSVMGYCFGGLAYDQNLPKLGCAASCCCCIGACCWCIVCTRRKKKRLVTSQPKKEK